MRRVIGVLSKSDPGDRLDDEWKRKQAMSAGGLPKARFGRMDDVMARCVEHRHLPALLLKRARRVAGPVDFEAHCSSMQ